MAVIVAAARALGAPADFPQFQPGVYIPLVGVAALMVMHLGVAAVALPCYARFLPLPTGRTSAPSPVRPPVDGAAQGSS